MCQKCQRHQWKCATRVNYTTSINDTGRKFCHLDCWCCQRYWYLLPRCFWHRWQIIGTISDWLHLTVNLKEKNYLYVNSTTQRCPTPPNKIIKTFLVEDFCICHRCNDTGGAPWAANISVNFRKKLERPYRILRGLGFGETDSWMVQNLVALSL